MSRNSFKLLIAAALLLLTTTAVQAQMSQMRLFSPYPDDQFGGGTYMNNGFYGTVGAGVMSISKAPTQTFGYTGQTDGVGTTIGGVLGTAITTAYNTNSQVTTASMEAKWVSTMQYEIGNQQGHHGWFVRGMILSPQYQKKSGYGAGITIYDPPVVDVYPYPENETQNINFYVYTGGSTGDGLQKLTAKSSIGRLWGIVGLYGSGTSSNTNTGSGAANNNNTVDEDSVFVFVPLVLSYDSYEYKSTVNNWSVEAMYNYRMHPFRRGVLEFMAGIRYDSFEETVDFTGHATTKLTTEYTNTVIDILQTSNIVSNSGSSVVGEGESFQQSEQNEDFTIGSDLGYSMWNFKAFNHLIGPQFGLRYTLANNRWRYSAESRFFAALNRQNIKGSGDIGFKAENSGTSNTTYTNGNAMYTPLSTVQNSFDYAKYDNVFSPCADLRLEAAWHWTSAVSFKFGYNFLYLSNIARSSATNDYRINEDGSVFGVKPDRHDYCFDTFIHGAMFTVQINK